MTDERDGSYCVCGSETNQPLSPEEEAVTRAVLRKN